MNQIPRTLTAVVALLLMGAATPSSELHGLWQARLRFGPDVRGPLTLREQAGAWSAEIAGRTAAVRLERGKLLFDLADGQGAFRGTLGDGRLTGFWTQPPTVQGGGQRFATPVTLLPDGHGRWRGDVQPLDDAMTLYLSVGRAPDGSTSAFLRNPERNIGAFMDVTRIERKGNAVELIGRRRSGPEVVLASGTYDGENGRLLIDIPNRGGVFDFHRVDGETENGFYPRGKQHAAYRYVAPPARADGWPVGTLEEVGLAREPLERFVQMLAGMPMDSSHASEVHGLLVARRGKLVLEEYFHGFHRDLPHDMRSAAKSLTATLVGAAIQDGAPFDASTPVYSIMNEGRFPPGLEARKRALTVEHLLTMSSGLDCDDADAASPGNQDTMQEQTTEPDFYRYTLNLGMIRDPGAKSVYCSANPNLLGGVLQRATGHPLPELFDRLLAKPLGIGRYHLNLTSTGDAYMGGGVYMLPRDFMKLGQLMLDGGTWQGRRIVSKAWAERATSPLNPLGGIQYGYLWWVMELPYKGRTVRAFLAAGNGGQAVIGVPALELLVAFYGGNYSDPVFYKPQRELVPQYILPAVDVP